MHICRLPLLLGALLIIPALASAQDPKPSDAKADPPPVALLNAQVDGYERPVAILIARGKIRAVDPRARALPGMQQFNLGGARVVPGRVDAWASAGSPNALGNSLDAFDPYDRHAIERALSGGVTTIVLTPFRSPSNSGLAAILKLKPDATDEDRVLVRESAVCASLGLGTAGAPERAAQADGLRRALEGALAYRDAWADYEQQVEDYAKELEKAPKAPAKPPAKGPAKPPAKDDKGKKKDDGPKKPKRPGVSRAKALLVRVLDGELPLRVEAHRSSDIVNVLELAEAFGIDVILEGASEAYLLADVLAKRNVPVVLGPVLQPEFTTSSHPVRHSPHNAALLDAAGVTVIIGSDGWTSTGSLELNALTAQSAGLSPEKTEAAITHAAANLVGLGDRLGKVEVGYDADLVVVRPGPLGERSVRAVFVDGELAWRAPK